MVQDNHITETREALPKKPMEKILAIVVGVLADVNLKERFF